MGARSAVRPIVSVLQADRRRSWPPSVRPTSSSRAPRNALSSSSPGFRQHFSSGTAIARRARRTVAELEQSQKKWGLRDDAEILHVCRCADHDRHEPGDLHLGTGAGWWLRTILGAQVHVSDRCGNRHGTAPEPAPDPGAVDAMHHWNHVAIDSSGLDHTPVAAGDPRVFGEQLGPGRSARAMAIVHIAIFDAVNAIAKRYRSYTGNRRCGPRGLDGCGHRAGRTRHARRDVPVAEGALRRAARRRAREDSRQPRQDRGHPRRPARGARHPGAHARTTAPQHAEPQLGTGFITSDRPGKWRQDPISQLPVALGAHWGEVEPFVIPSAARFRVPPPPAMTSRAYTEAFNEVKRLGGDGVTTPNRDAPRIRRSPESSGPTTARRACARRRGSTTRSRVAIADQMGTDIVDLARLLALVNVAMSDAGVASWESKYLLSVLAPGHGHPRGRQGHGPDRSRRRQPADDRRP